MVNTNPITIPVMEINGRDLFPTWKHCLRNSLNSKPLEKVFFITLTINKATSETFLRNAAILFFIHNLKKKSGRH